MTFTGRVFLMLRAPASATLFPYTTLFRSGVGKSTVAANLAVTLEQTGARVGLCDCDIYGPSISLMFGTRERPTATDENMIVPIEQYGLRPMSMGFLLDRHDHVFVRCRWPL